MNLEGTWPVHRQGQEIGQCSITRQGLYWHLDAHCAIPDRQVYRLALTGQKTMQSLGIPVPEGDSLTLRKRLSFRHITIAEPFRLELLALDEVWSAPQAESETPVASPDTPLPSPVTQEDNAPVEMPATPVSVPESATMGIAPAAPAVPVESPPEETTLQVTAPPAIPAISPEQPLPKEAQDMADAQRPKDTPTTSQDPEDAAGEDIPTPSECSAPSAGGVLYDPGKPLPPLENWEALRAVPDGKGGFYIRQIDNI